MNHPFEGRRGFRSTVHHPQRINERRTYVRRQERYNPSSSFVTIIICGIRIRTSSTYVARTARAMNGSTIRSMCKAHTNQHSQSVNQQLLEGLSRGMVQHAENIIFERSCFRSSVVGCVVICRPDRGFIKRSFVSPVRARVTMHNDNCSRQVVPV